MEERSADRAAAPEAAVRIAPDDEANRELVANVHPAGWKNPEPPGRYDLLVIGGGTGGLVTAAIAAALGARVALVERHLMGGDCLNVGCVPSKAVLRAARAWAEARSAADRFGGPEVATEGSFSAVMERMRRIRAGISAHDSAHRFRELGVDVHLGQARFTSPESAEVEGRELRFRRAVIATGGRPAAPSIPGLEEAGYLTNETVFSLTELPRRLAVVGGGPIGCELAQAFARLGARVVLLEKGDRLLSHDDPDAAEVVRAALQRDGVEVRTSVQITGVERRGGERVLRLETGDEITADEVLLGAGRRPNVEELGLERAEIRCGERGIETDDRLQTSNSRVYAVGDVNGRFPFTHAADAEARMVVRNALFFGRGKASDLVVPWCTYTSPELAHVGLTAEEAAKDPKGVETLTVPVSELDRARLDGATEGFLRLHLKRDGHTILGATLVSEHAGELIGILTSAMTSGVGLDRLGETIFPYPTLGEVVRKAADARRRQRLTPRARKAFELFFRVVR